MNNRLPKLFSIALVFALIMSMLFVVQTAQAAGPSVFINEIHYDNSGTDTGEAVEIAGPAGTDLTGWSLVLYNGNGGASYNTTALSGTIPDLGSGFGVIVIDYPTNGLQNGSPDGLALVDSGNNVIQFLSYEGSFTAADGPAAGMTSTDIGVSETSSTTVGYSLQLTGTGTTYEDFTWAGSSPNTFESINRGQAFIGGEPTVIVIITEIMQNPSSVSDSSGEWFELYNAGSDAVDVNGWTIADADFDSHVINNGGPLLIPTGGYLVLGNNTDNGINGGANVDYGYVSFFLSNVSDEVILLDGGLNEIDRVEYDGGPVFPDPNGASMSLYDPTLDNNDGSNWCTSTTPFGDGDFGTPGAANTCVAPVVTVKIHEVQGSGSASPLVGQTVAIEGIVVGDFQDGVSGTNGDLNGFHLQEEDADADADLATSEGVFVFNGNSPAVDVQIGDLVRVEGAVSEFNGLTEITSFTGVTVINSGNALPTASVLSLPVTSVDDFEAFEGMLVTFSQALYIAEYFNFDRFGEMVLTSERQFQPTSVFDPGSIGAADLALANALGRITLDDGRSIQNPDPAIHPNGSVFDLTNLFRGGDTIQNVTGVMDYAFGLYRIQPTQGADYTNLNPRTALPDDVGGNLNVASFNVLNYFITLDNSGPICGPLMNQDCRGADDATEFTRQRDKIISALTAIDADVVGLIEIENYPGDDPTADLVSGLNAVMGAGTYDYIATGAIGSDAIRVAFIYKPATVSPVGSFAVLDSSVDSRFDDVKNRPSLAQTFMDDSIGGIFTVAVNHLKSKGSSCGVSDPDTGDGSGNCNLTRQAAAEALVDWLASDPTESGAEDYLIIGDLNSYDKEDPIDTITAGGYTDLIYLFLGEDAYSFVFGGQLGYLNHALANAGLIDKVTGLTVWHINADEPDLINYDMSFKGPNQDAIYAPDAYRSSDHDPVIIGLDVCDEIVPTFDETSVTPDMLWPANHKYVEVVATVVVSDNLDPNPIITLVSITSNEPDNGVGDGNTVDDIVIIDDFNFKLRAERSGVGTGRIYTITYMVTDTCGNSTTQSVTVTVPHSKGKK
jgi:predicted extracellular nuclease